MAEGLNRHVSINQDQNMGVDLHFFDVRHGGDDSDKGGPVSSAATALRRAGTHYNKWCID